MGQGGARNRSQAGLSRWNWYGVPKGIIGPYNHPSPPDFWSSYRPLGGREAPSAAATI